MDKEKADTPMLDKDGTKGRIDEKDNERGTYFDDAILLCGYGKFHYFLFVAVVLGQIANVIVTAIASYILANAECDLKMTMVNKGTLNAMPFAGMLTSGLLTGFLSDALGRKIFLVWGYIGMGLSVLVQATSQTFTSLLVMKFVEGFIFTAPFTVAVAYMGETHDNKIRSRVMLFAFCFIGVANTALPLIGWSILPYDWALEVVKDTFVFRSWHLFLAVNSLWALATGILFVFLPESPKFVLSHGNHNKALSILRQMYSINTGKPPETYPVTKVYLKNTYQASETFVKSLKDGVSNIRPLFSKRYMFKLIHICIMQFCIMLSFNTFRLWYPQLSTIFENYSKVHNESAPVCVMINEYMENKAQEIINTTVIRECITVRSGAETYINTTILGLASIVPYVLAGCLINKLGKKVLIFITMGTCGTLASTLYLAMNATIIVFYFAVFLPMAQITVSLMLTVTVDAFPTAFRALTVSALMLIGRTGALLGNIGFPYLLEMGCLVPFILVASLSFSAAVLGLLIPKDKK